MIRRFFEVRGHGLWSIGLGVVIVLAAQLAACVAAPLGVIGIAFVLLWGVGLFTLCRSTLASAPDPAPSVVDAPEKPSPFTIAAERCLAATTAEDRVALFLVALDHRERLSDLLGPSIVGDAERIIANVLDDLLRKADLRARFDDGRFAALITGMTVANASEIAERLKTAVEASLLVYEGRFLPVRTAIGVVLADGTTGYASLLATAEAALDQGRSLGRGLHLLCEGEALD